MGPQKLDNRGVARHMASTWRYGVKGTLLIFLILASLLSLDALAALSDPGVPRKSAETRLGFVRSPTPMICQMALRGRGTFTWSRSTVYVDPSIPSPGLGESLWIYFDYSDPFKSDGSTLKALQLGDGMRFELTGFSGSDEDMYTNLGPVNIELRIVSPAGNHEPSQKVTVGVGGISCQTKNAG